MLYSAGGFKRYGTFQAILRVSVLTSVYPEAFDDMLKD